VVNINPTGTTAELLTRFRQIHIL